VRILIVDDHEVVRHGLKSLLEAQNGWTVCGQAGDGREALEKAAALKPDLVVVDIGLPRLNGVEVTRRLLAAAPRTLVLVLSTHQDEGLVREILAAGARGYVLKSDAARDLVSAVESLRQGRPFFSAQIAGMVLEGFVGRQAAGGASDKAGPQLTDREREVLQLLAEGNSTKEVASTLKVSVKTAESHRANLMKKLGLESIGELVRYAVRNHIVEP